MRDGQVYRVNCEFYFLCDLMFASTRDDVSIINVGNRLDADGPPDSCFAVIW